MWKWKWKWKWKCKKNPLHIVMGQQSGSGIVASSRSLELEWESSRRRFKTCSPVRTYRLLISIPRSLNSHHCPVPNFGEGFEQVQEQVQGQVQETTKKRAKSIRMHESKNLLDTAIDKHRQAQTSTDKHTHIPYGPPWIAWKGARPHRPWACHAFEPCGRSTLYHNSRARWFGLTGAGTSPCTKDYISSSCFHWLRDSQIASNVFALSCKVLHCTSSTTLETFSDGIIMERKPSHRRDHGKVGRSVDSGQVGLEKLNTSQVQALSSQLLTISFAHNGQLSSWEILHKYFLSALSPFPYMTELW